MASFILLSGDLRFGGYPIVSLSNDVHRLCNCDGQFSENALCRNFQPEDFTFLPGATCSSGFCKKHLALTGSTFGFNDDHLYLNRCKLCSSDASDARSILVFIQGGTRFGTNSTAFIYSTIIPSIAEFICLFASMSIDGCKEDGCQ